MWFAAAAGTPSALDAAANGSISWCVVRHRWAAAIVKTALYCMSLQYQAIAVVAWVVCNFIPALASGTWCVTTCVPPRPRRVIRGLLIVCWSAGPLLRGLCTISTGSAFALQCSLCHSLCVSLLVSPSGARYCVCWSTCAIHCSPLPCLQVLEHMACAWWLVQQ